MPIAPLLLACLAATVMTAADTQLLPDGVRAFDGRPAGCGRKAIDETPDHGPVLRLVVDSAPEKSFQAQTGAALAGRIEAGDRITIAFTARCTAPADRPGIVSATVALNAKPWTQAVAQRFEIGPAWKEYTCTLPAKAALDAGQASFGLAFGHQAQAIEVARLSVVDLGRP